MYVILKLKFPVFFTTNYFISYSEIKWLFFVLKYNNLWVFLYIYIRGKHLHTIFLKILILILFKYTMTHWRTQWILNNLKVKLLNKNNNRSLFHGSIVYSTKYMYIYHDICHKREKKIYFLCSDQNIILYPILTIWIIL